MEFQVFIQFPSDAAKQTSIIIETIMIDLCSIWGYDIAMVINVGFWAQKNFFVRLYYPKVRNAPIYYSALLQH